MHPAGPKHDYDWHLTAFDRAMAAGQDDVGAGVLFGLADYGYELIALLLHARHLEEASAPGPIPFPFPRLRPAQGVGLDSFPHLVDDRTFKRIVALIRLALPYTGIILSTREAPSFRREVIELGVSQISAASCTGVGGYSSHRDEPAGTAQFQVEDGRSVDEVLSELCRDGYIPSFCTACYRQGRTGDRFMSLAKSGKSAEVCAPNALLTFAEYLLIMPPGHAGVGLDGHRDESGRIPPERRDKTRQALDRIRRGEGSLFLAGEGEMAENRRLAQGIRRGERDL